jgi:hypothetical protein
MRVFKGGTVCSRQCNQSRSLFRELWGGRAMRQNTLVMTLPPAARPAAGLAALNQPQQQ